MKNAFTIRLVLFLTIFYNGILRSQGSQPSLCFKENKGQVSDQFFKPRPDILFSGTDGKIQFHLRSGGVSYQLNRVDSWMTKKAPSNLSYSKKGNKNKSSKHTIYRIDINWINATTNPEIIKGEALPGFENYYGETCPDGALNVKSYENILYKNIYPGIDLKWFEKKGALEYDYYIAPFADYKKIKLEYKGAEKIYLTKKGELIIQTPLGIIAEQKPMVMQNNKKLEANWVVQNNIISFDVKRADASLPMIIDPMVRLWGTYYGGAAEDYGFDLSTDNAANVYLSGETESTSNIATSGVHQTTYGGTGMNIGDAYVVKFNAAGVRQWATYYGGAQDDFCAHCEIDGNGNVYMVGGTSTTNSAVMATPGAHQSIAPGSSSTQEVHDAFLVKFNSSGVRQWGTYYGGSSFDFAIFVDLNAAGDIVIAGVTNSSDGTTIGTIGCHQPVYGGGYSDGFLARFNAAGVRQWGTYYGGNGSNQDEDDAVWCSFDANGDIYLLGGTPSANGIATGGSHQTTLGGADDGFLVKFNSAGQRQWGTYYGGSSDDILVRGSLDAAGNVYVCGGTSGASTAIATTGCHQSAFGGVEDGILVKFNSSGVRQWGTYYGGTGDDTFGDVTIDPFGNIYAMGFTSTNSSTAIATPCAYQSNYGGGSSDIHVAKFTPTGSRIWGSYFGSIYSDEPGDCAVDINGNLYLTGSTYANSGSVMVSTGAYQTTFGGMTDAFLEKFDGCIVGSASNTTPPVNLLVCAGKTTTLNATCGNWYNSPSGTTILATGGTFTTGAITSDSTFYVEDFGCGSITGTRTAVSVTLTPAPSLTVTNSSPLACVNESAVLTVSGASTYSWINTSATTPTIQFYVLLNTTYTVNGVDANGCQSTATLAVVPNLCLGIKKQNDLNSFVSVYPNPNNGAFTVQSGLNLNLVLTNELGQIIKTLQLTSVNNFQVIQNDLPDGIYFLKGEKESRIVNQKIVVLK